MLQLVVLGMQLKFSPQMCIRFSLLCHLLLTCLFHQQPQISFQPQLQILGHFLLPFPLKTRNRKLHVLQNHVRKISHHHLHCHRHHHGLNSFHHLLLLLAQPSFHLKLRVLIHWRLLGTQTLLQDQTKPHKGTCSLHLINLPILHHLQEASLRRLARHHF